MTAHSKEMENWPTATCFQQFKGILHAFRVRPQFPPGFQLVYLFRLLFTGCSVSSPVSSYSSGLLDTAFTPSSQRALSDDSPNLTSPTACITYWAVRIPQRCHFSPNEYIFPHSHPTLVFVTLFSNFLPTFLSPY